MSMKYRNARVCVCVTPDMSLCLRMASLIMSYVTSSVQLTSAFLVMLGSVPAETRRQRR